MTHKYDGNPSRKHWLAAMHPFGGYTPEKQKQYLDAWMATREAKSVCPICGGRNKTATHFRDTLLSSRICEGSHV